MEYLTTWMIPENILREGSCTCGYIYVHPYDPAGGGGGVVGCNAGGCGVGATVDWGVSG